MNKNFQLLKITVLCLIGYSALAQTNEVAVPLSDPSKRGKLKVHINSGSVTVKGTARKDVLFRYSMAESDEDGTEVEVDIDNEVNNKAGDKSTASKAGLKKISSGGVDLEITEHENSVKATSGSWNNAIKLEIEVPSGFDLQLHTYNNGDLTVNNIQGILELTNYNGAITALNISGSVVANTFNGEIRVTFDKVTPDTPMSYSTYTGDVDVTLPATVKSSIKVKTDQGSVYSDFDLQLKSSGPTKKTENKGGVYKIVVDEWKAADLNGGGPEITMRNYTGDIIIRKK